MADNDSSTTTLIVALVAIVVIIALGFILYRGMPGAPAGTGTNVQLNLPTTNGGGSPTP